MTTGNERQEAAARIGDLVGLLKAGGGKAETARIVEECEALARAIGAFHMEGIRFRMYNVDRLLAQYAESVPAEARGLLETARQSLDITTERFQAGAIAYLALLDAQRTYQQARILLVIAQANRYEDTVALFTALGGGWWNRQDVREEYATTTPAP